MYSKKENETKLEHLMRLSKIKIENKPNDLDWQDISEIVGINIHRDTLRKAMSENYGGYAIMKYYENQQINGIDNDILLKIKEEKEELQKIKMQLQDQKREYRNKLRKDAKFQHIIDEMTKTIKELPKYEYIKRNVSYNVKNDMVESILILSDWHFGLNCNNFWNKYNVQIARERMEKLKHNVIFYCKRHNVTKLHIEIIGDMINGNIHLGNKVENEEDVISQTMQLSEMLGAFIYDLSKEIPNIIIYTTYGNHGRTTSNKKEAIDTENFERLIEWYLSIRLENVKNILIQKNSIDETFNLIELENGKKIICSHGNYDKVSNVLSNYSQILKTVIDEIHLGHFHSYQEKDCNGSTLVINGTFSGTDTYAKNLRLVSNPMQTLRIYENKNICTYKIYL